MLWTFAVFGLPSTPTVFTNKEPSHWAAWSPHCCFPLGLELSLWWDLLPCAPQFSGTMDAIASHRWWEWSYCCSLYPASRVLQLLSAGPRCCFLFRSWVLSHGIACHHWATLIQLCVLYPLGPESWLWLWHCWGWAAAAPYPVPWSQRHRDSIVHRVPLPPPHSLCHYCISPYPGATTAVVSPKDSDPGSAEDAHAYPQALVLASLHVHWGTRTKELPRVPDAKPRLHCHWVPVLNLVPRRIPLARNSSHRQKKKTPSSLCHWGPQQL